MRSWFSAPFAGHARGLATLAACAALTVAGCSGGPSASAGATGGAASATPTALPATPDATAARPSPTADVHFDVASLALGPGGTVYGASCEAARVVTVDATGPVVIAGSGPGGFQAGFSGDGDAAIAAQIACPVGLAVGSDGTLYVSDHNNNRVRAIGPDGGIRTVAGSGAVGSNNGSFSGDGGPATEATLQEPTFLLLDDDGNLYISDRDNNRVRKVATDGMITTVAGNGEDGFAGDGGPATEASLDDPAGLAMDARGRLYIADSNNQRIRVVDLDGLISTVAGTGTMGSTGDGGPAKDATLADPEGLAIAIDGTLYLGEAEGNRIRRISPDGIITAYAGTGENGYTGDGGAASLATLSVGGSQVGIALDPAGNLYIPDIGNLAIRVVRIDGTIETFALT